MINQMIVVHSMEKEAKKIQFIVNSIRNYILTDKIMLHKKKKSLFIYPEINNFLVKVMVKVLKCNHWLIVCT